ncbi:hypothetical protein F4775DRAFT_565614 [Biscogniauxia sp. FL1348]|nr:hypothetical protein F4775DRAFT_565614 [Biscogniauxia sp. FL1348]
MAVNKNTMGTTNGQIVISELPVFKVHQILNRDPNGRSFTFLGKDGVLRVIHSREYHVIDASGLAPIQIKEYLDTFLWSQEKEETFRGVDGTKVPREELFNPPSGILPKKPTEEERAGRRKIIEEHKRSGVKGSEGRSDGGACKLAKRSDHQILSSRT